MTASTAPPARVATAGKHRIGAALPLAQAQRVAAVLAPAVLSAALMLGVGAFRLGRPTLGWDELATLSAAQRPLPAIGRLANHIDGVLAPYYAFMHFWVQAFGTSEVMLRLPSLIAVATGVGLAAELGRRLFGPLTGLLAGGMLVLVPSLSFYAQEARSYGLAFCFATLATLLCYRACLRASGRLPAWAFYAAALALAGLAHILTLLIVLGHAVIVYNRLWRRDRRATLGWLAGVALAVLPVLPFVRLGLHQRDTQLSWMRPPTWQSMPTEPAALLGATLNGSKANSSIIAMTFLLIGLALMVRGRGGAVVAELATLAVAPSVVLLGFSLLSSPIWMPRYALASVVPLALLASAAVIGPPPIPLARVLPRAAVAVALLAVLALPGQRGVRAIGAHVGGDYRAMARILGALSGPQDAIVYGEGSVWALRGAIDYYLPPAARPTDVLLAVPARDRDTLSAAERPAAGALGQNRFVWYIKSTRIGNPLTSTDRRLRDRRLDELRRHYRPVSTWHNDTLYMSRWERIP
jgi:mannosyltransferase